MVRPSSPPLLPFSNSIRSLKSNFVHEWAEGVSQMSRELVGLLLEEFCSLGTGDETGTLLLHVPNAPPIHTTCTSHNAFDLDQVIGERRVKAAQQECAWELNRPAVNAYGVRREALQTIQSMTTYATPKAHRPLCTNAESCPHTCPASPT